MSLSDFIVLVKYLSDFIVHEKTKLSLLAVFIVLLPVSILCILFVFLGESLKSLNDIQGFLAFAAILIALLIALLTWSYEKSFINYNRHLQQNGYLQLLIIKLDYLARDGVMKIFKQECRISTVDWAIQLTFEGNLPSHKLPDVGADFFARVLDEKINGKSTFELKKALFFIRDKTEMANFWLEYIIQNEIALINSSEENKTVLKEKLQEAFKLFKGVTPEIKQWAGKTKKHITDEFKVEPLVDEE